MIAGPTIFSTQWNNDDEACYYEVAGCTFYLYLISHQTLFPASASSRGNLEKKRVQLVKT